ncbi:Rpn family recombination-promoting nuclease/putative transposase [Thermodesulfobium sp. 4217-1]|uniref:Rpn family recombination-promoting nuclease/putative transposase n=1 Tax=Thermodesulfobium sp. 4217-1 TaxID=3120013 RepID=UPI0032216245
MNEIHQVHDKFFKHIISNKENAKSFIEFALPKEIKLLIKNTNDREKLIKDLEEQ